MQIHELTKRRKTNEGLLDSLKAGIAGAKAVGQAAMSPTFAAVTGNQGAIDAAEKSRQAINKKYGLTGTDKEIAPGGAKRGAGELVAGQTQDAEIKKAAIDATNKFKATPEFATIIDTTPVTNTQVDTETPYVEPGYKLTVPSVVSGYPTDYYIGTDGSWRNDLGQQLTDQSTISKLNGLANQGQDSGKIKPTRLPLDQQTKQKQPRQSKPKAPKPAAPAASAAQAKPIANESAPAAGKNIDDVLSNMMVNSNKVRPVFDKFSKEFETTRDDVKDRADVIRAWDNLVKVSSARVKQGKDKRVAAAFQNYATVVLSAMKAVGTGEDSNDDVASDTQPSVTPAAQAHATQQLATAGIDQQSIDKIKNIVQTKPATKPLVKQAIGLDEQLSRELRKLRFSTLYEDSVQITKDIIVKTNLGNYVKKAEDQTWYDPNGIPIDPVKYADYIKKLDATPAAQTRYQADSLSGRGSDTAFNKAKNPAPAQAPAPQAAPDPLQQMADQEKMQAILRNRDVAGLNSMIQDTFNQLQNAKIFKTGQEDYLNDRMKALMAMKA